MAPKQHFGWTNNNPLNIRISPNKWVGKIVPSRNAAFETFDTPENGLRATVIIMSRAYKRSGINTLIGLIQKWAPEEDNNRPLIYANSVAKDSGYTIHEHLDLADFDVLCRIIPPMSRVETGQGFQWSAEILAAGIRAGLGQLAHQKKAKVGFASTSAGAGTAGVVEMASNVMDPSLLVDVGGPAVQDVIASGTSTLSQLAPYIEIAQWGLMALVLAGAAFTIYQIVRAKH